MEQHRALLWCTVDLSEMIFNAKGEDCGNEDTANHYAMACRCGGEYILFESDLNNAGGESDGGEIDVGCSGCSSVIRVTFAVES